MTSYQELHIATLEAGLGRVTVRTEPDLPDSIVGAAVWLQPDAKASGDIPPPTYHALHENYYNPVEFINDSWFWLEWDENPKFRGYWSRTSNKIDRGQYHLGWKGRKAEAVTPRPISGPSFSTPRERAESASTQLQEEAQNIPEDDDFIDRNPEQTAALASQFAEQPIFEDIAEAIEGGQDRSHYLPTTLPSASGLRPTSFNPIRVRSTTTGGATTAAATHDPTRLITNAIKIDGQLKGRVPDSFDGDRTKTQTFTNAFDLFWMTNKDNAAMKSPYRRCTFFLGLLQGPKVEDWVVEQAKDLRNKTMRRSDPIAKDDETLWEDLKQAFTNNYAHTRRMEEARADLSKLQMEGDLIDDYISRFENLLSRGEIPRSEVGAIEKFKDGLKYGVLATILRRDTWPTTIDDWEEAAHREVRRFRVIKESLRKKGDVFGSPRPNKWNNDFQNALKRQKKSDVVPMEIDAASIGKPNKQKWSDKNDKLKSEGRCFKCQKQGHMKKDCPEWKRKPLARIAEAEEEPKEGHKVARVIKSMDDQQREDLLDT